MIINKNFFVFILLYKIVFSDCHFEAEPAITRIEQNQ